MNRRHKLLLVVALLFTFVAVVNGDWASILKELKSRYDNYQKEIKDITILREAVTKTERGEITSQSKTYKKGEKYRHEMTIEMPEMPEGMEGMQTIVIYDGKDAWMISPFTGKVKLPKDEEKNYRRPEGQEDWWSWLSEEGKLTGSETVEGHECWVVQFEPEKAPFTMLWLDKKTLLAVKAEFKGEKGSGVVKFSDYRKIVGESKYPYRMEIYMDDEPVSRMVVKSIEINQGLSDDLFDPDKVEVKGNMREMMRKMREQMMKGGE